MSDENLTRDIVAAAVAFIAAHEDMLSGRTRSDPMQGNPAWRNALDALRQAVHALGSCRG
jgi:hypothetical protein